MSISPPITVPTVWSDGQVLFAAALNGNFSALLNWINNNGLTAISSSLTLFVSPSGSDSNTGLSAASPFLTVTHAYDTLASQYFFASPTATATIQLADGTYNEAVTINNPVAGQAKTSSVIIQGNVGTPSNVVITGTPCVQVDHSAFVTMQGFRVTGGSLHGVFCRTNAVVHFQAIDFGTVPFAQCFAYSGGYIAAIGNYSISGSAQSHVHTNGPGAQVVISIASAEPLNVSPPAGPTVTLTGTPAFSSAFAAARFNSGIDFTGVSFSGSATGSRYVADGSYILTGTSGALTLPGSSGGSAINGGIYF
jgi:hypothetical protein